MLMRGHGVMVIKHTHGWIGVFACVLAREACALVLGNVERAQCEQGSVRVYVYNKVNLNCDASLAGHS